MFGRPRRESEVAVRVWVSEEAAACGPVAERAVGYLRRALDGAFDAVDVTAGGAVPVPTQDAHELMTDYDWPRAVAAGALGLSSIDASVGANLLVTNGDILSSSSGGGLPHFAAVGGAEWLARAPPADAVEGPTRMSLPRFAAQVVLHECGHALGLEHRDGTVVRRDGGFVVTPMVSGYAWAPENVREMEFGLPVDGCSNPLLRAPASAVSLSMSYSSCAVAELRST